MGAHIHTYIHGHVHAGAFQVPTARCIDLDSEGMTLEASIVETGFFGNKKERTEEVAYVRVHLCVNWFQKMVQQSLF